MRRESVSRCEKPLKSKSIAICSSADYSNKKVECCEKSSTLPSTLLYLLNACTNPAFEPWPDDKTRKLPSMANRWSSDVEKIGFCPCDWARTTWGLLWEKSLSSITVRLQATFFFSPTSLSLLPSSSFRPAKSVWSRYVRFSATISKYQ